MAFLVAEKIFVDPNEEISFLTERIKSAQKEHVIIIVPSSSILFTSNLSIKVLFRTIVMASKVVIIVTEDSYGARISQKVGFVVVQKVSQITSDLWDIAKSKLFSAQSTLNTKKNSLLKNIKGETDENDEDDKVEVLNEKEKKVDKDNSKKKKSSKKTKIEEKIKEIRGIKIYGGADIANFDVKKKDTSYNSNMINSNSEDESREELGVFSEKRFAGRDLTKITPERRGFSKFFNSLFFGNKVLRPEDRIEGAFTKKWYKRRSVIIFLGFLIITGLLVYLTLFQFSSVAIRITLDSKTILAEETVEIDTEGNISSVDADSLLIPGREIKTDEISLSKTATTDSKAKRGDKATGAVYIFNKEREVIQVPAGTQLTSVRTGKVYETVEDVSLPEATEASDLSINPSRTDNIRVTAISFGEDSNIEDSDPDSGFIVDGFNTIDSQDIKREGEFTGGTSEEFISVSQEDFETVKDEVLEDLKDRAIFDLKRSVPNGFILLEETVEFEEIESVTNPEVGEEAKKNENEEYFFDVSVVIEASAIMIKEKDLEEIIRVTISKEEEDIGLNELNDIGFKDFIQNNNTIFITIFAEGEIVSEFNKDDFFTKIKGKSIGQAREIIRSIDNIKSFDLKYFPSLVPESVQFVGNTFSRVNIRID